MTKSWSEKKWDLDEHQLRAALTRAEVGGVDTCQSVSKLLLFLYAKDILSEETPGTRKLMFDDVLHGTSDTLVARRNRLKAIVEVGEKPLTRTSLHPKSLFESFIESHPEWAAGPDVFVAHRDHPSLRGKEQALFEGFQKGGSLCYMHAPVVLQHYLVAMNNTNKMPMLNIAELLKKKIHATTLHQHIWHNEGETLRSFLSRYLQHVGSYKRTEFIGRHAMVLIGSRKVGHAVHYLLQNWWTHKAHGSFFKEEQLEMGNLPTTFAELVESEVGLDARENTIPDDMRN
ncbi:hypothetical protein BJ741DRAFT_582349 [Chytriomyces cf. hyalinus JEL632]|nr:hypothetical protein BJ741DRAFT_582349 [Chytriomyces cf. hyalinus JEL632]